MKGNTSRESEEKNPTKEGSNPGDPSYHVDYRVKYEIEPPYTVVVD
jgi:hypothetical protein